MSLTGYAQLAALGVFFLTVSIRAIRLRVRLGVQPVWFALDTGLVFGLVCVWACVVVWQVLSPETLPVPGWLKIELVKGLPGRMAGIALIILAFAIHFAAMRALGAAWRLGLDERGAGELVVHGIYAYSRNPVYLFFVLYFTGTYLVNGQSVFLLFLALLVPLIHWMVLREERFLAERYGAAYHTYRDRVSRYLPMPARFKPAQRLASRQPRPSADDSALP